MCGIIGIALSDENLNISQSLVDTLTILQHRGQDAAGIVTADKGRLNMFKNKGHVSEVFDQKELLALTGNVGIGHVRYPTAGGSCTEEAQPFYTSAPFGIAIAHNGNLTNTEELKLQMQSEHRYINTKSDSELLLNVFAEELQRKRLNNILPEEIFATVRSVMQRCKGAFSVVILISGVGLLGFRDPYGIRPLSFGSQLNSQETVNGYAFASESVAINAISPDFTFQRDVAPGEAIFIDSDFNCHSQVCHTNPMLTPCIFEHVYFARPDSIMDGVSVYESRLIMGEKLAKKILKMLPDLDIDVVMPVPDTSRTSALKCSYTLCKPYREGFIKNRYIHRTFIMPGQAIRQKKIRLKLNPIDSEFKNKAVLLVDDSIVRGTTSKEIIQMARDSGARKVYFASAAPAVRYPNVYGIDIPTSKELVAANDRTEEEIANVIGADKVIYNDLKDLIDAVQSLNPAIKSFETSCFDGKYVGSEVTQEYLDTLDNERGLDRVGVTGDAGCISPTNDHLKIDIPLLESKKRRFFSLQDLKAYS